MTNTEALGLSIERLHKAAEDCARQGRYSELASLSIELRLQLNDHMQVHGTRAGLTKSPEEAAAKAQAQAEAKKKVETQRIIDLANLVFGMHC